MDELTATQRVTLKLKQQELRSLPSQPNFYNARRVYYRHWMRRVRRFKTRLFRALAWLAPTLTSIALIATVIAAIYASVNTIDFCSKVRAALPVQHDGKAETFLSIVALMQSMVLVSYWFFCWLKLPSKTNQQGARNSKRFASRIENRTRSVGQPRFLWPILFAMVNLSYVIAFSVSTFWFLIGVIQVIFASWIVHSLAIRVGTFIFTCPNGLTGKLKTLPWQCAIFMCWVLLNMTLVLSLEMLIKNDLLPHANSIPVVGWLVFAISQQCQGNGYFFFYILAGLMALGAFVFAMKKAQSTIAFQREYLTQSRNQRSNELSFEAANSLTEDPKADQNLLCAEEIAKDFRRLLNQNTVSKYWAKIDGIYLAGIIFAGIFPVLLLLLMNATTSGFSTDQLASLHLKTACIWCPPLFIINLIVRAMSDKYFRVKGFWQSPLTLVQWWQEHSKNYATVIATTLLCLLPCFITILWLYWTDYPWTMVAALTGYCILLTGVFWMIGASAQALWGYSCLLPAWTRYLKNDFNLLIGLHMIPISFCSVAIVAGENSFQATFEWFCFIWIAPVALTTVALAAAYFYFHSLGKEGR